MFGRNAYGDPSRGEGYEHANFLPALRALGHDVSVFESFDRSVYRDFAELNGSFVHAVSTYQPDVILSVLMGYELWAETLDLVRARFRAPLLNWGTDDSWKYDQFTRFVAPHVDIYATTSPDAAARAKREGLSSVILTQWAASDAVLQPPLPARECRYAVSFVGAAYGNRKRWVQDLDRRGIRVQCFGHGWPHGPVGASEVSRIVRESAISLNFGDSGLHLSGLKPYRSRQIKARVFEVPGAGGFLLTEPAPQLERYYRLADEIETFASPDEAADKIRRYLADPGIRDRIAMAGYERTRSEHTYTARFAALLQAAAGATKRVEALMSAGGIESSFSVLCTRHGMTWPLALLRSVLTTSSRALFGARRGPRAARRLVFELSWRLAGAHTYSASGWPGRLFYRES